MTWVSCQIPQGDLKGIRFRFCWVGLGMSLFPYRHGRHRVPQNALWPVKVRHTAYKVWPSSIVKLKNCLWFRRRQRHETFPNNPSGLSPRNYLLAGAEVSLDLRFRDSLLRRFRAWNRNLRWGRDPTALREVNNIEWQTKRKGKTWSE